MKYLKLFEDVNKYDAFDVDGDDFDIVDGVGIKKEKTSTPGVYQFEDDMIDFLRNSRLVKMWKVIYNDKYKSMEYTFYKEGKPPIFSVVWATTGISKGEPLDFSKLGSNYAVVKYKWHNTWNEIKTKDRNAFKALKEIEKSMFEQLKNNKK